MKPLRSLGLATIVAATMTTVFVTGTSEADSPGVSTTTTAVAPLTEAPMQGFSVEAGLNSAAARIEAAAQMQAAVDERDAAERLAEIERERAAAQERLARLQAATTTVPVPQPTVVTTTAPPVDSGSVWDRLCQCEATGNWHINSGNGYYGGLQFHPGTWKAYGGHEFASNAHLASREQQIVVAERVLAAKGGRFSDWPGCRAKLGLP